MSEELELKYVTPDEVEEDEIGLDAAELERAAYLAEHPGIDTAGVFDDQKPCVLWK